MGKGQQGNGPTYQRIKTELLSRIQSGNWRAGDLIPGEEALAAEFGCSRLTVHRAVRELADEGIVERRRKAGTRVMAPGARGALFDIPRVDKEVEAIGAAYRYALLERTEKPLPDMVRGKLETASSNPALHVRCLHYANERPFQYEDRWINLDVVSEASTESFEQQSPNAWLLDTVPWSDAEHVISAENASPEIAERLGLNDRDAVLVIERRTWRGGDIVTFARFYYPGTFHRLRTTVS